MTTIRRMGPGDAAEVVAAEHLFDGPARPDATARFLTEPGHHLLLAYDEDPPGRPVGMVTGVETTHPDKGTEMFLYELSVDPAARRGGVGRRLVDALGALARERGCYGMWVGTEAGNLAARATYERAGARETRPHLILEWKFGDSERR